jgi:hypothetical protein
MSDTFHPDYIQPEAGYDWRCMRCENQWRSNKPGAPKPLQCSKCRSGYWDRSPVRKPREKKVAVAVESTKQRKARKKSTKPKREVVKQTVVFANVDGLYASDGLKTEKISEILAPPPHLRRAYSRPQDEPSPESMIRKPKDEQ